MCIYLAIQLASQTFQDFASSNDCVPCLLFQFSYASKLSIEYWSIES